MEQLPHNKDSQYNIARFVGMGVILLTDKYPRTRQGYGIYPDMAVASKKNKVFVKNPKSITCQGLNGKTTT